MNMPEIDTVQHVAEPKVGSAHDACSLVILHTGKRKAVPWPNKLDLARQAGVKFVRLVHNDECRTNRSVNGFQHVYIRRTPTRDNRTALAARWAVNEYTKEPIEEHGLNFAPNDADIGVAYLPLSPHNLVRLASAELAGNALWRIDDEKVLEQVRKVASDMENDPDHVAAEEEVARVREESRIWNEQRTRKGDTPQASPKEAELHVLRNRVHEMTVDQQIADLRSKLDALVGTKTVAAQPADTVEKPKREKKPIDPKKQAMKDAREKAKSEIYAENEELVREVKRKHQEEKQTLKGWGRSPLYTERIAPLIDQRCKEILSRADTGASVLD